MSDEAITNKSSSKSSSSGSDTCRNTVSDVVVFGCVVVDGMFE